MTTFDHRTGNHFKKSLALMLLLSAGTLFAIGGAHPAVAQPSHISLEIIGGEIVPLHEVEPEYPVRALQRNIEGWAQVKFTITAAGTVDPQSIEISDAQPRGMFDSSAMRAIAQFTFKPRMQNGVAVEMPNVQYVFRYDLDENEE